MGAHTRPRHAPVLLACWTVLLACHGVLLAAAHGGHQGCGHSRVAGEARRWSQLHRQQQQQQQQQQEQQRRDAAVAAEAAGPAASVGPGLALAGELPGGSERPAARRLGEVAPVPIRIWVEYQGTEALSAQGKQHLHDTVNIALGVLQKFFKVRRPAPGRLTVKPFCRMWDSANYCNQHQPDFLSRMADNSCGAAAINSSHIAKYTQCSLGGYSCDTFPGGQGEFTDYYLYITAHQDEHCSGGAVAWALPCLYDDATNRPLLGSANICPEALVAAEDGAAVAVLVHELTHALGFTDDMFDKFVDADGAAVPQSQVVKQYTDVYGRRTAMIVTPTVVKEARAQFGCDEVPGAALENEGGQGSANAHWEYRWFQGELMVATNLFAVYGKPATMSRITLAFMQDTGWYDVNWDAAGFLDWGFKAGCDFVGKTCQDFAASNPGQQFFCTRREYAGDVNTVCTFDGLARAKCEDAQFADGCIMKVALGQTSNCLSRRYASSAGDKFGWQNGPSSRCSPVTWLFTTHEYQFPDSAYKDGWRDAMCYKSSCTAAGALQLDVLGRKVDCPTGATVDLAAAVPGVFTRGQLGPCPDNAAACASLACGEACTAGGTCHAGRCYCDLQFVGKDCSKRLTADGNYTQYRPAAEDGGGAAGGGGAGGEPAAYDNGYLMLSVRLESSQEALYLSLDKFKTAVAQLAGVTASRVAVLSFLSDAPATSLIGRRLAEAAAAAGGAAGGRHRTLPDAEALGLAERAAPLGAAPRPGAAASRQLLQAQRGGGSGQLEVYSRIASLNKSDADAIAARVGNSSRQDAFADALSAAGLKLVRGSVSVRSSDAPGGAGGPGGGWGLPGLSLSDPNTRRIIIIVACSVGAALLAMALGWTVACCLRRGRRRRPPVSGHPSQQQFLTRPPGSYGGGGGGYSPGGTPNSSGGRSASSGSGGAAAAAARPGGGVWSPFGGSRRPPNPFAAAAGGGRQQPLANPFAGGDFRYGGGSGGAYAPPPPAATPSVASRLPAGGYVIGGRTFGTLAEAEEYQLALALQRSLSQSGPPAHFLPHSGGGVRQQQQQQQQQQQPGASGYPPVGYGFGR